MRCVFKHLRLHLGEPKGDQGLQVASLKTPISDDGEGAMSSVQRPRLLALGGFISILGTLTYGYPTQLFSWLQARWFENDETVLSQADLPAFEQSTNYMGATVFVVYIIAALIVTISIVKDLIRKYQQISHHRRSSAFLQKLWLFVVLSLLSFAFLSYNMLSFLVYSYLKWFKMHADETMGLLQSMWIWMTRSTLFYDFVRELASSEQSLLWTRTTLAASMVSSFYISSLRQAFDISGIILYCIIGQILPTSFMVNLFFVAVLLRIQQTTSADLQHAGEVTLAYASAQDMLWDELALICGGAYACFISYFASLLQETRFLAFIVAARVLLVVPFSETLPLLSKRPLAQVTAVTVTFMAVSGNQWLNIFSEEDFKFQYALKALGVDFLVLSISVALWVLLAPLTVTIGNQTGQKTLFRTKTARIV